MIFGIQTASYTRRVRDEKYMSEMLKMCTGNGKRNIWLRINLHEVMASFFYFVWYPVWTEIKETIELS